MSEKKKSLIVPLKDGTEIDLYKIPDETLHMERWGKIDLQKCDRETKDAIEFAVWFANPGNKAVFKQLDPKVKLQVQTAAGRAEILAGQAAEEFPENHQVFLEKNQLGKKNENVVAPGVPKEHVDMLLGQMIAEMKHSLDIFTAFMYNEEECSRVQAWKNVYYICLQETQQVKELMEDFNAASLNPRHRATRELVGYFLDDALPLYGDLMSAKRINKGVCTTFAKLLIGYMEDFHQVLSDQTSRKDRNRIIKDSRAYR
jgi:hypothetical protein